jgi:tRNA threonylcarbamoyladenosine biosynthesis protein TsaE
MKKFTIKKSEIQHAAQELLRIVMGAHSEDTRGSRGSIQESRAALVTLSGDLGAGKTTLTQEVAKVLGVTDQITSPTFVIMKKYKTTHTVFKTLIHIDAYRLNSSAELQHLGFEELMQDSTNLIVVEWPERVPECVESPTCKVVLSHVDEETRSLEILV